MRDREEEKTMKGLKRIAEENTQKYNDTKEQNKLLKKEIDELQDQLKNKQEELKEDAKNRELLNDLYSRGIIDEDGTILQ